MLEDGQNQMEVNAGDDEDTRRELSDVSKRDKSRNKPDVEAKKNREKYKEGAERKHRQHKHHGDSRHKQHHSERLESSNQINIKKRSRSKVDKSSTNKNTEKKMRHDSSSASNSPVKAKVVPISLEELLEKRKKLESEMNKPKFITKEDRMKEAIRKREEVARLQRERIEIEKRKQLDFLQIARPSVRDRTRDRDRDRDGDRNRYRGDRDRDRDRNVSDNGKTNDAATAAEQQLKKTEAEEKAIRDRYLGQKRFTKRRQRKLNERKFVFEWDAGEDTSVDYNNLYQNKHQIQFFGRGGLGGVDIKTQKKELGKFYARLLNERRTQDQKDQEE